MHAIDLRVVCILCFHAGKMNGKSILIYSKAAESDALCICTLSPTHALPCVTVCGGEILIIYLCYDCGYKSLACPYYTKCLDKESISKVQKLIHQNFFFGSFFLCFVLS